MSKLPSSVSRSWHGSYIMLTCRSSEGGNKYLTSIARICSSYSFCFSILPAAALLYWKEKKEEGKRKKKTYPVSHVSIQRLCFSPSTPLTCVSVTQYMLFFLWSLYTFNYCSMYSTGGTVCTLIGWFIQLGHHRRDTLSWMQMRSIHQTMSTTAA